VRIFGVDPGLNATGYGLVDASLQGVKIIEAGSIEPRSNNLFQDRLCSIYQHLAGFIVRYHPDVLVLEKLYAHARHPATAPVIGHVRGVICLLCAQHHLELVEYSVKRVRKALIGNGNATKEQTRDWVRRILKLKNAPLTLDTSDALALALGHAHMKRFKIL